MAFCKSMIPLVLLLFAGVGAEDETCSPELLEVCAPCMTPGVAGEGFNCSLPGLETFTPGMYQGVTANYLSFATETACPNFPLRAQEFEACTGGKIVFSEAANVWEDPIQDLGTKAAAGIELYDGYFMSYSHFPEVSALNLAERLNDRIREDNSRLKFEDVLPKVRRMGEYRRNGETNIDFLMYDGDFFVPLIRLDLLEKHNLPLPNTWDEVVEMAKFFNGTDLNDDGDPNDFGFCHFPRLGAGYWDWWWTEAVYSTWATFEQTKGEDQGFFFDTTTMEPRIGEGFKKAASIWKDLWTNGADGCITDNFITGRCAIGFAPPGCWKGIFIDPDGVSRKDENGTVIWKPRMKSGEYAEPYRFKPFGSIEVFDRETGSFKNCTGEICPKAEPVPAKGHLDPGDRANVTRVSPLEGQLVNRAPFYWSGGLGTLIRKSATDERKDLLWDFFVYTNSAKTSVYDVANYASWLDSWRYSQIFPGDNFLDGGWSYQAYTEDTFVVQWALSTESNGALNLRIPGLAEYTRDTVGEYMSQFINGLITVDELVKYVKRDWIDITGKRGKLDQLEIYRAALNLDSLSTFDLCTHHRSDMDREDPSVCRRFDQANNSSVLVASIAVPTLAVLVGFSVIIFLSFKRKSMDSAWSIQAKELHFDDPPEILGRGTFGLVLLAEYRGTQVAVKRVIPPKEGNRTAGMQSTGLNGSDNFLPVVPTTVSKVPMQPSMSNDTSVKETVASTNKAEKAKETNLSTFFDAQVVEEEVQEVGHRHRARRRYSYSGMGGAQAVQVECQQAVQAGQARSHDNCTSTATNMNPLDFADIESRPSSYLPNESQTSPDEENPGMTGRRFSFSGGSVHSMVSQPSIASSDRDYHNHLASVAGVTFVSASGAMQRKERKKRWNWKRFRYEHEYEALKADFVQEMRQLAALRHPCIVSVMGAVIAYGKEPMLVLELMDMGSLYDLLHNETFALEGDTLLPILRDIGQGVRFLHAATPKVIHGDLKAQNVLVDSRFRAKVADFGLSQKKKIGATGTPLWMAPELLRGESENTSMSDVYSFGMILYEVYSRKDPYEGENVMEVLRQIADPDIEKRPSIPNATPPLVASLMVDCFNGDPDLRPTSEEIDVRLKRLDSVLVAPEVSGIPHRTISDGLLYEIFPKHVADALREGRKVEPEKKEIVTIFFSDIVGFTTIASKISPMKVSDMLDRLYLEFDELTRQYDIFKVETIGDAYMCVTNLVKDQTDSHAKRIALFAMDAITVARKTPIDLEDTSLGNIEIRVGFHSGPVIASVIGSRSPKYGMFGDTVNVASRMESTSQPGRIQLSERSADILQRQYPEVNLTCRGDVNIKGKGLMKTFMIKQTDTEM